MLTETKERLERNKKSLLHLMADKARIRQEKAIRSKQERDLKLQLALQKVKEANTQANSGNQSLSPPQTAVEKRKQQLLAKKQAIAERTQANLLRLHAEREAKIAALDAKYMKIQDIDAQSAKLRA